MELNFQKLKTDSGAPLWVMEMPFAKTVSTGVLVMVGTRDENWPKEAGIAHALEHMLFQGTEKFPTSKDVSEYIEEVGGDINAWTAKEMTFYHTHVPVDHKERAVHILSEQIRKSIFPEDKILIEMKNIVQELRRRNDNPQQYLGYIHNQVFYGRHPLSKDTLGTEDSVSAFTRNDFLSFQERFYKPSNFAFIIVGGITSKEAVELFNKYFPEEAKFNPVQRPAEQLEFSDTRINLKKRDIEQVHLILGAAIGAAKDKETLYLEFFRDMISGGMSFPLFQEVRDKRGLCYSIGANIVPWSDVGSFSIYVGTDPKRYKEAISASLEVVEKSKNDEKLLEKVKQLTIGALAFQFQTPGGIIGRAADEIAFLGAPRGYKEILEEIEEIVIQDIERVVDKYLKPERFYTTMLAPNDFKA